MITTQWLRKYLNIELYSLMRIPMLTKDTFAHKLQCHHEDLLILFILEQHPPPRVRSAPRHQKSSEEDIPYKFSFDLYWKKNIIGMKKIIGKKNIIGKKKLEKHLFWLLIIWHLNLDTLRFKWFQIGNTKYTVAIYINWICWDKNKNFYAV